MLTYDISLSGQGQISLTKDCELFWNVGVFASILTSTWTRIFFIDLSYFYNEKFMKNNAFFAKRQMNVLERSYIKKILSGFDCNILTNVAKIIGVF